MKVVIITQYYPPHVGGLEIVAQKQARSLKKAGHNVAVITCVCAGASPGDCAEEGVRVRRAKACNYLDRRIGLPFALPGMTFVKIAYDEVKDADCVLLHDALYPTSWFGCIISTILRKPLFLVQHVGMVLHPSKIVLFAQRLTYASIGSVIFWASRRIVVFNDSVRSFLAGRGIDQRKIVELRNGVDLEQFRPASNVKTKTDVRKRFGLPVDRPLVLFVGRLVPKKGWRELLEAAHRSFELVFVGGGQIPLACPKQPHLHFLGPLSHADLSELYPASDVFVLPAVGEIFTVAMQEAMASGLPIVIGDDPGYASCDVDRSLVSFVKPRAVELQRRILTLLGDTPRRERMSLYSRSFAEERFNWEKNFDAFAKTLISERPLPANRCGSPFVTELALPILPKSS